MATQGCTPYNLWQAIIVGVGFVATICAYVATRVEFRQEMRRKLRQSTLDDIGKANAALTRGYYIAKECATDIPNHTATRTAGEILDHQTDREAVFDAVDRLHYLAVGFLQGNYDDETFATMLGSWYPELVQRLQPFIDYARGFHGSRKNFYKAIDEAILQLQKVNARISDGNGDRLPVWVRR